MNQRERFSQEQKNLLSEIRVEKNKTFYLNQSISATEYEQIKKKETSDFKADLKSLYKLEFKVRYTKYYNIAYMCTEKEMDVIEEKLKIFITIRIPVILFMSRDLHFELFSLRIRVSLSNKWDILLTAFIIPNP